MHHNLSLMNTESPKAFAPIATDAEHRAVLASAMSAAYELKRKLRMLEAHDAQSMVGYTIDIKDVNNVLSTLMVQSIRSSGLH